MSNILGAPGTFFAEECVVDATLSDHKLTSKLFVNLTTTKGSLLHAVFDIGDEFYETIEPRMMFHVCGMVKDIGSLNRKPCCVVEVHKMTLLENTSSKEDSITARFRRLEHD